MLWKRGALKQKCTENSSQNPWKILMRKFIFKFTGDGPLLKINTFTKIFEEAWPQFQLATFLKIYCIEQLILHSSSGWDFWKSIRIIKFYVFKKIFYNESISSFLPGYSFVPTAEQLCKNSSLIHQNQLRLILKGYLPYKTILCHKAALDV